MQRKEEYLRMRQEEESRPLPPELNHLEARVRAKTGPSARRPAGKLAFSAALCAILVLGTAMAWGLGGFHQLVRLMGRDAEQLSPYYQSVGQSVDCGDYQVTVDGIAFTTRSYTVLYQVTASGGEWDETEAWGSVGHSQIICGPSGSAQAPFDSFMEPHRQGQALEENGQSGWGEWLYGDDPDSAYYLLTMNTTRPLEEGSGQTLQLYFSRALDGVPETDAVPGGTLLSFPVENVLQEVTVPLADGPCLSLSVSPVSIVLDTTLTAEEWSKISQEFRPELALLYSDGTEWVLDEEKQFGADRLSMARDVGDDGLISPKWHLRQAPPDLSGLTAVRLDGTIYPVSPQP